MTRRAHIYLSSLALALTTALMVCFAILCLYIPYMVLIWEETEKELSGLEQMLVRLSESARAGGIPVAAVFGVLILVSFVWRVYAAMRPKGAADQTLVDVDEFRPPFQGS